MTINAVDQCVMLKTSLVRDELFTWLEEMDCNPVQIDTWTITDHPAPNGSTFTLYAMSVLIDRSTGKIEADRLISNADKRPELPPETDAPH